MSEYQGECWPLHVLHRKCPHLSFLCRGLWEPVRSHKQGLSWPIFSVGDERQVESPVTKPKARGGKKIQNKTKTSRSSSTLQSWWLWLDCLKKRCQWSFPGCCPFAAFFVRGFRGSEPKHHHYVFGLLVFLLSLLLVWGRTMRSLEGMSPGPSTTTESADCVTWFRLWRDV